MGQPTITQGAAPSLQLDDSFFTLIRSQLEALQPPEEQARMRRIGQEALRGFEVLAGTGRSVSIFGSGQDRPAERWGRQAREVAQLLARAGFAVITGGGPGLMAEGNRGAKEVGGPSLGLTIDLPIREPVNPYVTLEIPFHYFFLRKLMFVKYACAFVCFPGGYGTLDELFEALNLVRTGRLGPFPVILYGSSYWSGLREWLRQAAVAEGCLTEPDLELFQIVDTPEAVVRSVEQAYETLCLGPSAGLDGEIVHQARDGIANLHLQGEPKMTTLMQPLRDEHQELLPHIEQLRAAADLVGERPPAELASAVERAHEFLSQLLLPHAEAEERALYPVVAQAMGSAEATATMTRDHVEVGRLAEELAHLRAQLHAGITGPAEARDLRRVLYGLYALVKLHFTKEEEVYLPLLEQKLTPDQAGAMFQAMGHAAKAAKQAQAEPAALGR